jgi:hypothetical protein
LRARRGRGPALGGSAGGGPGHRVAAGSLAARSPAAWSGGAAVGWRLGGWRLGPLRRTDWVDGPKRVLAYLARYTHRVAISNDRLLGMNGSHVSFRRKDSGGHKTNVIMLKAGEFIRRFLLHVLPDGFHRIRNYGLLANGHRAEKLARCRKLLDVPPPPTDRRSDDDDDPDAPNDERPPCPCCGGRMQIFESFRGPQARPFQVRRLDTS